MRLTILSRGIFLTATILPIAHADVSRNENKVAPYAERLELDSESARIKIEEGDTLSHILYAIKLKVGSRVPLYGRDGLVERFHEGQALSGLTVEIPLKIFAAYRANVHSVRTPAEEAPAIAVPVAVQSAPVVHVTPTVPVIAAAPTGTESSRISSVWELGLGLGFTRLDGDDQSNQSRGRLISKMSPNFRVARYFFLADDFQVGTHFETARVDFDSEATSVQVRRNFDLLSSFAMSFEKSWGLSSLAFAVGVEESLFYYSRTASDITVEARPTTTGEVRLASPVFKTDVGALFLETYGKLHSASEGTTYSVDGGYGYGFALRVKEFDSGSSCGFEYGVRQQSTTFLNLTQPHLDLSCAVRF